MTTENIETLTIDDLVVIRDIINIASERGAFRANELSAVGTTFDKLSRFLDSAKQQFETQQTDSAVPQGE